MVAGFPTEGQTRSTDEILDSKKFLSHLDSPDDLTFYLGMTWVILCIINLKRFENVKKSGEIGISLCQPTAIQTGITNHLERRF